MHSYNKELEEIKMSCSWLTISPESDEIAKKYQILPTVVITIPPSKEFIKKFTKIIKNRKGNKMAKRGGTINRLEAYLKIRETNGAIFTARFIKKDGTRRSINCRLGVYTKITGKGMSYNPLQRLLLPVWDMQASGYRNINLNTMYSLIINGTQYSVR
jgi:hypothetical protein